MLKIFILSILLVSSYAFSAERSVVGAKITTVRAYERSDGSTQIYLAVNNRSRVGPNPSIPSVDCELWTHTKEVFSVALAAKASGQMVNIVYVPWDNGDAYCKVRYLEITE